LNGTTIFAVSNGPPSASVQADMTTVGVYALAAADYVEMCGNQDSGGALNMVASGNYSPEAAIFWYRT
jgi:hypothetical protein